MRILINGKFAADVSGSDVLGWPKQYVVGLYVKVYEEMFPFKTVTTE